MSLLASFIPIFSGVAANVALYRVHTFRTETSVDSQVSLSPSLLGEGAYASRWAPKLHMIIQIPPHLLPKPDPGPYAPGRVCVHKDCITRLNRNNPGPYCQLHWMDQLPPEERDDAA